MVKGMWGRGGFRIRYGGVTDIETKKGRKNHKGKRLWASGQSGVAELTKRWGLGERRKRITEDHTENLRGGTKMAATKNGVEIEMKSEKSWDKESFWDLDPAALVGSWGHAWNWKLKKKKTVEL